FHHKLVSFGMSHKQTVLFMYGLSAMFSIAAILRAMSTIWGTVLIAGVVRVVIQILIESLELIDSTYKPVTNLMTRRRREDRCFGQLAFSLLIAGKFFCGGFALNSRKCVV